jgi:hypothetical protein
VGFVGNSTLQPFLEESMREIDSAVLTVIHDCIRLTPDSFCFTMLGTRIISIKWFLWILTFLWIADLVLEDTYI